MRRSRLAGFGLAFVIAWAMTASAVAFAADPVTATATPPGAVASSDPETPAVQPVVFRLQDDDIRLAFRGTWRYYWGATASGSSRRYTVKGGSYVLARFSGTGITLVAPLRSDGGTARIRLDGATVATVSLYSSTPTTSSAVWSITGLSAGNHAVQVIATGAHEASSTGTVVSIDAFDVEGRPYTAAPVAGTVLQQDDWRLYRHGTWRRRLSDGALRGSAMRSTASGSAITIQFKGSSLAWLGRKAVSHGRAGVWLDGRRVATVGGASATARERAVLWAISGLAYRTHTVVIRNLGRPSDSAVSTGTIVDVDAFVVGGTASYAPRPTPFSYSWRTYIVVDKSQFRLYWVKDGVLLKYYPIAHGKIGWTTPNRTWRIDAKYHTDPGSVYGPRKMRMFRQVGSSYVFSNYAIHGTNEEWVIGTRASHGCIRMYNRDVLELFPQVPLGTMVVTRD